MKKFFFDAAIIVTVSPFLIILIFLTFILVITKTGFPVIFKQPRPGLHGEIFTIFKFRTMTIKLDSNGEALADEIRTTKFGDLIRSTSLDELPSLWNVLRGEMSLVGPRPLLVEYLPLYSKKQSRRHDVKPGLTGWAQVNGRNGISWNDKFDLDLWYVDNQSLWLDFKILCLTVKKVILRDGINQKKHVSMDKFKGSL